jgi:flagellar basal-body rod modification protein FlgD
MRTPPVTNSPNQLRTRRSELQTEDFIRMMITQLQNQDPLKPASNQELMQQMAQISQMQSSTMLQTTLKELAVQNQIGAAGNLIGKMVEGLDENNERVSGMVASVRIEEGQVYLELDGGQRLKLGNVTIVAPAQADWMSS